MRYRVIGYGDRRDPDNLNEPRGETFIQFLCRLPEHISWAIWEDKCRYVTVEAEGMI